MVRSPDEGLGLDAPPAEELGDRRAAPAPKHDERPLAAPMLSRAFALFGAAAGLFAILTLGGFRDAAREVLPLAPLIVTAIIGALAGVVLGRIPTHDGRDLPLEAAVVRVGGTSVVAGALSGAIVGWATWGEDGVSRFAVGGAVVGALLYPGCNAVFRAAVRSTRARHGSLVAAADRRTVTSTLLAGAAVLAALQIPALLQVTLSERLPPLTQAAASLVTCLAAVAVILRLRRNDARDREALEGAGQNETFLERVEDPLGDARPTLDLGVGDGYFAHGASRGYRAAPGAADLRGSVASARAAFAECERARHHALLVSAGALVQVAGAIALRATELFAGGAR